MRFFCEIAVVAALLGAAWQKPLSERISLLTKPAAPAPAALRAQPVAAASPSGAWMWDKNRRTALDRPAYNNTRTFTGHIYYMGDDGRKYWLDAEGKRHYDD